MLEQDRAARAATITIFVPGVLRDRCGGKANLAVRARDVRGALGQLEADHPLLYRSVCDETGTIRRHLNLFINSDNIRDLDGVDSTLAPGDVLTILPAVSGG